MNERMKENMLSKIDDIDIIESPLIPYGLCDNFLPDDVLSIFIILRYDLR